MTYEQIKIGNTIYIRTHKTKARRAFNQSFRIAIIPKNLRRIPENITIFDRDKAEDFDTFVNSYSYYNCNYTTGYPAFFVPQLFGMLDGK